MMCVLRGWYARLKPNSFEIPWTTPAGKVMLDDWCRTV